MPRLENNELYIRQTKIIVIGLVVIVATICVACVACVAYEVMCSCGQC